MAVTPPPPPAPAPPQEVATSLLILVLLLVVPGLLSSAGATWCVARSDAGEQVLQTALDYACGSGANCVPIQPEGLCYLPNTMQAHASYAFNSYYQLRGNAPGTCDFSGTATVAKTDPSYGSCVYPPSPSQAGGAGTNNGTGTVTPSLSIPPPRGTTVPSYGGFTPGMGTSGPSTSNSIKIREFSCITVVVFIFWTRLFLFVFYAPIQNLDSEKCVLGKKSPI